ncbi:MAG: hypothetical protein OEP52_09680 [Acidimicrobiia bacterium]|nr:hypothetical protein [Acidimicrobiia bacterium]
MRQIHPRTSSSAVLQVPVPLPVEPVPHITVDLREVAEARHPSLTAERLRLQLAEARHAVDVAMEELSALIDKRENLKAALGALAGKPSTGSEVDDQTVVPWGFYDDEL